MRASKPSKVVARKGVETANDRIVADRVARAKAKDGQRSAEWYERCGELARDHGLDPGDVFEFFDERAAMREYEAGVTRAAAEDAAFGDTRDRFVKQRALAV